MELSSRQLVVLAAPLVVVYLTYSTVQRGANLMRAVAATQAATAAKKAAPAVDRGEEEVRNPFSPVGKGAGVLNALLGNVAAAEEDLEPGTEETGEPLLTLNGTVITSRWRFAIINGERVVEGQRFLGLKVDRIEPERVTLSNVEGETLELALEIAKVEGLEESTPGPTEDQEGGIAPVNANTPPDILDLLGIPKG